MSSTIDERVVEMQFDNKQFEKGISESIQSLDSLKKSLDLNTVATKTSNFLKIFGGVKNTIRAGISGIGNITRSVKNFAFSLTGLNSVINSNISGMTSFLASITGGAIASGFQEYELKVNSVRTILSNVEKSGKNLGDVTEALEELNAYADKTIYNFAEMTRNIGYFTVAGVGLEESVSSIKGFMNLAALQGVDATAAARATYQLSQAMSTGSMRLMDWRSMENAGMGGKQFQDLLVEVGKAAGVQYDNLLKKHKSFRETLSEGWLTSDIMLKGLQLYSGDFGEDFVKLMYKSEYAIDAFNKAAQTEPDLSGLEKYGLTLKDIQDEEGKLLDSEAAGKIIADAMGRLSVEERELETIDYIAQAYKISKDKAEEYWKMAVKANQAAKEVTTMKKLVDALGEAAQSGWSASWEIIIGNVEEAKHIFTPVSEEIGGIIQASADARNKILKEWKQGTITSTEYDEDGKVVKHTYALYDAIANFWFGVKSIAGNFKSVLNSVFEPITSEKLIEKTKGLLELSKRFREFAESPEGLAKMMPFFNMFATALGKIKDAIGSVVKGAFNLLVQIFTNPNVSDGIGRVVNGFTSLINKLSESKIVSKFFNILSKIATPVLNALGSGLTWIVNMFNALVNWAGNLSFVKTIGDFFKKIPGWVNVGVSGFSSFFNWISDWFTENNTIEKLKRFGNALKNTIVDFFKKIGNRLSSFWISIKEFVNRVPILSKLKTVFSSVWDSIKNWFKNINFKKISFKSIFESIKNAFANFKLPELSLKSIWDSIKSFFKSIPGKIQKAIPKISKSLTGVYNRIKEYVKSIFGEKDSNSFWQKVKDIFAKYFEGAKKVGKWLYNAGKDTFKAIGIAFKWLFTVGFPALFAGIKSVVSWLADNPIVASSIFSLIKVWLILRGIYKPITNITVAFKNISKAVVKFAQAKKTLAKAELVKSVSKSIFAITALLAVISGSVALFANLSNDQYDQAKKGLIMAGGMLVAMGAFAWLVKKLNLGSGVAQLGGGALALVLSIFPLILAIKLIDKHLLDMDAGRAIASVAILAGLLSGILLAVRLLPKDTNISFSKDSWKSILAMIGSMMLIVLAIRMLAKTIDKRGLGTVVASFLMIGALMAGMWALSKYGGGGVPKGLIGMALAIDSLAVSLAILSMINPKKLWKAVGAIAAMMAGMLALSRWGGNGLSFGKMVGLAVSIDVVTYALLRLSKLDPIKLGVSAASLGVIFLSLASFARTMSIIKVKDALKAVLNFAIIVGGITAVITGIAFLFSKIEGLASDTAKKDGIFNTFGAMIGEFVGSILSGIAVGSTKDLGTVADNLTDFGNKLEPFLNTFLPKLDDFSDSSFSKLTSFARALESLSGVSKLNVGFGVEIERGLQTGEASSPLEQIISFFSRKKKYTAPLELKQDFDVYAEGLSSLLESIEGFMDVAKEYTPEQLNTINTAFGQVKDFLNGLVFNLPTAAEVQATGEGGSLGTKGGKKALLKKLGIGGGQGDISANIKANFADIGKGLSDVLNASETFMATVAEKIPDGKFDEIKKAFDLVVGFMSSVNGLTLPEELSITAQGVGLGGKLKGMFGGGAEFSFAEKKRSEFEAMGKGLGTILTASGNLIKDAGTIASSDVKIEELQPAFDSVTGLLTAVSGLTLPTELENSTTVAGGLLSLFGQFGAGGAYVDTTTENTDFDSLSSGISTILDAAGRLISASAEVVNSDVSLDDIKPAFDNVCSLFSAISGLTLPTESKSTTVDAFLGVASVLLGGGGAAEAHVDVETNNTSFTDLASGVSTILAACGDYIKASAAIIESDLNLDDIKPAFDKVIELFGAISGLHLPEESNIKVDEKLGGWLSKDNTTTVNTTFDNLTSGVKRILRHVTKFVSETAKAQGDGVDVNGALGQLGNFMKSISNMQTPIEKIEISEGVHDWISTQYMTFEAFTLEVQKLIDLFTKYGTDMAEFAKNDEEGFNVFERATNQLTGFINAINGFTSPDAADTDKFGEYTAAMGSYSEPISDIINAISDPENGLFAAFVKFSNEVKSFTGDEQTQIGTALEDLVTFINGLNNIKLPRKLKIDWSGIETDFDLGELATALPDFGSGLAGFYDNLVPAVESLKRVYDAISSGGFADETRVVSFVSSIISMFTSLWNMSKLINLRGENMILDDEDLRDSMGKLVEFMKQFTRLLSEEELFDDYDLDVFMDFGAAIFEAIGDGFSDPSALKNVSGALGEAINKALDPAYQPETGGLLSSVEELKTMIVDSLNSDLTIRPVLQTDEVESALAQLSGKQQILNFNGSKKRIEMTADLSSAIDGQISRVVTAVDALGPKIESLGQSMKNIRVVLNTGLLVGALAPGMDSALASSANRSNRGSATPSGSFKENYIWGV